MPAAKRPPAKRKAAAPKVDLSARGAHVVSVFGPFSSRVLIEMPAEKAAELFPDGLGAAAPAFMIEAVLRDVELIRKRDPQLAESALAASALAMAFEIANPYNSATSKSMCDKAMRDALATLRSLAPAEETHDDLDEIAAARARRLAARSAAAAD